MAKELPYFKFEPSEWLEGEVQIISDKAIVCFINLCSGYWLKLGSISYAFALHKYCRKDTSVLDELISNNIIEVVDDEIRISFLDSQFKEFKGISEKRSKAANKRWSKTTDNQQINANALQSISKSNAIREEKIKEDNNLNIIPSNQKDFQVKEINQIDVIFEEVKKEKSSAKKEKSMFITSDINFSKEVIDCYHNCIEYFNEDLKPKSVKEQDSWMDTIDKLNRLEHLQFSDIELLVKSARQDIFWSKNFLSITKLRRKDKDKVPYWKVFKEKFKYEKTKTETTYNAYEEARKSMNL